MSLATILLQFQWHNLLQPQFYIDNGGLWLLLFIVFAETGLFVGFFLPGDSLLFVAGIFAHEREVSPGVVKPGLANEFFSLIGMGSFHNAWADLLLLIVLISTVGIIGNTVGYIFGNTVGHRMYHWKENLFFKKHYLHQAHDFYEKHGVIAIVFARFIPIVRTFAPIIAGIVEMGKKEFSFYNTVGCIAWVTSMVLGGYFLQIWILREFNFDLKSHLEIIVLGIILVTTAPVIIKITLGRKKHVSKGVN